jgi:hypothetical protein
MLILILVILAVIAMLVYFNRSKLGSAYSNWHTTSYAKPGKEEGRSVAYWNSKAADAAKRANAAQAIGDKPALVKALTEQRLAEARAAVAYAAQDTNPKPTVSGEVDGKPVVVKK